MGEEVEGWHTSASFGSILPCDGSACTCSDLVEDPALDSGPGEREGQTY